MSLPNVYQLLQDALEHFLFLCLREDRVHGKHPLL
jgi:hypothetical protein